MLKKLKQLVSFSESHKQTKALAKKIFFLLQLIQHMGCFIFFGGGGRNLDNGYPYKERPDNTTNLQGDWPRINLSSIIINSLIFNTRPKMKRLMESPTAFAIRENSPKKISVHTTS